MPVVSSVEGKVGFSVLGGAAAALPRMVAVACGGNVAALSGISVPTIAMNLRGYRDSQTSVPGTAAFGLEHYISDVDAVMKDAKISKTALFGYSHGGYFAVAYACANPKAVSALILVEPALYTDRDELLRRAELAEKGDGNRAIQSMLRYVQPQVGLNAASAVPVIEAIMADVNSSDTLAGEFRTRAENPIQEKQLAELKMPVLVIGGTGSHVKETVTRTAAAIPMAKVWWVNGATHLDLMSEKHTSQISGVVDLFLSGLS